MKVYIKYMVSIRCKLFVMDVIKRMGLKLIKVELGFVEFEGELTTEQKDLLSSELLRSGLELMDDKKSILIEKIKNVIVEMIHYNDELPKVNFSVFLAEKLNYDYTYLSNLFSETEGSTIEHFIIMHKIERVKELIIYNELNLTEIAWKMHYSSVAHLSNQFKKVTGLTPSFFKTLKDKKRVNIESL